MTSNKTKYVEVERKLNANINSYTILVNGLTREVSFMPTKGLTKKVDKWI